MRDDGHAESITRRHIPFRHPAGDKIENPVICRLDRTWYHTHDAPRPPSQPAISRSRIATSFAVPTQIVDGPEQRTDEGMRNDDTLREVVWCLR